MVGNEEEREEVAVVGEEAENRNYGEGRKGRRGNEGMIPDTIECEAEEKTKEGEEEEEKSWKERQEYQKQIECYTRKTKKAK